ncbi:MAG: hypothetical protein LBV71_19495 [Prevotella sp.]|jgi:hypothetical protein|nr:hypothetical protein [Prevotella sp.]
MLFSIRIPSDENMKRYNIARRALALAYLIVGIFNCYKTIISSIYSIDLNLIRTLTLVSASYQALLFTFALLMLIQPAYVSVRRVSYQFGIISFVLAILLVLLHNVSSVIYNYFYGILYSII